MASPSLSRPTASVDVLNSWKEIAAYLNRGVRTVQRWESDLGLPVRRPRGSRRSAVIAMRSDLDQWLHSFPVSSHGPRLPEPDESLSQTNVAGIRGETREGIALSQSLRHEMQHLKSGFTSALDRLIINLQRIAEPQFPGDTMTMNPGDTPKSPVRAAGLAPDNQASGQ